MKKLRISSLLELMCLVKYDTESNATEQTDANYTEANSTDIFFRILEHGRELIIFWLEIYVKMYENFLRYIIKYFPPSFPSFDV